MTRKCNKQICFSKKNASPSKVQKDSYSSTTLYIHILQATPWKIFLCFGIIQSNPSCNSKAIPNVTQHFWNPNVTKSLPNVCYRALHLSLLLNKKKKKIQAQQTMLWSFLRIWSHLMKKSLMENFIFCVVGEVILSHIYHSIAT